VIASRSGEHGYTLLELLVAMTLFALLSLVLVAGMHIGVRIGDKSESANVNQTAIHAAQRLLARDLEHLYPAFLAPSATEGFVDFDGTATQMRFLTTAGEDSGLLKRVTVWGAPQGKELAMQYASVLELMPRARAVPKTILHHLASLSFSYFGADDRSHPPTWRNVWQRRRSAPLLIRVRAEFVGAGPARWPDLVVQPRVVADVGCLFDPISKFCLGR
jgi:prepilin-type N-terminal cleavage/methylation domain-containing protein